MSIRRFASFGILAVSLFICGILTACNQSNDHSPTSSASIAESLGVVPDLDSRLAKFKSLDMPLVRGSLSARELQLVQKLVDASNAIEQIYWRQSDREGLELYTKLEKSRNRLDQKVLRFMKINGGRYDLIDELKPFVGAQAAPPGRALYSLDLKRDEIEKYVEADPGLKKAMYD